MVIAENYCKSHRKTNLQTSTIQDNCLDCRYKCETAGSNPHIFQMAMFFS